MRSSLYDEKDGVFEVMAGSEIVRTLHDALVIAHRDVRTIRFNFNEIAVAVDRDTNPDLMVRDYYRALQGSIAKSIGPDPKPTLTEAELRLDAEIQAGNDRRRAEASAAYQKRQEDRRAAADAKLAGVSIELADAAAWETFKAANTDAYGGAVLTYAERWARLMQLELAAGRKLEDTADAASSEADVEGITGYMYGAAVGVLARCWKHGEALRRWHNLKQQLGTEGEKANETGGVLNPAILTLQN